MSFHKKTDSTNKLFTDALQKLDGQWEALSQKISAGHSRQEDILQNLNKIYSTVTKHDMEIEDLIDALEGKQSAEGLAGQQIQELRQSEARLLELFEAYQEQFFNMKHYEALRSCQRRSLVSTACPDGRKCCAPTSATTIEDVKFS